MLFLSCDITSLPEGSNRHVRSLGDEDDLVLGRSEDLAAVHGPQPGQDAEQRGLPAAIRTRD